MESQPQNPEFRINPENFHPCSSKDIRRYKQGDGRVDKNTSLKQYAPITFSKLGGIIKCSTVNVLKFRTL